MGPFIGNYISVDPDETHNKWHDFYEAEHPVTTLRHLPFFANPMGGLLDKPLKEKGIETGGLGQKRCKNPVGLLAEGWLGGGNFEIFFYVYP